MRQRTTAVVLALGLSLAVIGCGPDDRVPGPVPGPSPTPIPTEAPGGDQYPGPDPDREAGDMPAGEPDISISPRSGDADTSVTITGSGFDQNSPVRIGFGPPESEYEIFARTTSDEEGDIRARVDVPDWAESGRDYLFVAVQDAEEEAISGRFRVR